MIPDEPERRPAAEQSLCLPAEIEHLPAFLEHVRRMAETAGIADAQAARLELAVEEALVNVCNHAYAGRTPPGVVQCRLAVQADGLQVDIVDEGPPFDPLAQVNPDINLDLDRREPGGLGILLIKSLVGTVGYRREGHRNVLTLRICN